MDAHRAARRARVARVRRPRPARPARPAGLDDADPRARIQARAPDDSGGRRVEPAARAGHESPDRRRGIRDAGANPARQRQHLRRVLPAPADGRGVADRMTAPAPIERRVPPARPTAYRSHVFATMAGLLRDLPVPTRALDVGAGDGWYAGEMTSRGFARTVVTADVKPWAHADRARV